MKQTIFILFLFSCLKINAQELKDCSSCATKVITKEQIKNLSIDELRFLTNDLFARKGYNFKRSDIDSYYSNIDWYKPVSDNAKIVFNDIEKQNTKLFQERVTELNADREKLITAIKNFKTAFLQKDKAKLNANFNYQIDFDANYYESENFKYLTAVVNNLNLDAINWYKKRGHYIVTVDNLAETISYKISINENEINFIYDYDTGSNNDALNEIEDAEALYQSDHYTEFTYIWKFMWRNGKLVYTDLIIVG